MQIIHQPGNHTPFGQVNSNRNQGTKENKNKLLQDS